MIQVSNLSVSYGSLTALRSLNLNIAEGECVLVTGPSGCGKSTLARVLAGLIPHAVPAKMEGAVIVSGRDVTDFTVAELAQTVGSVFQNPTSQLFHLRVEDDIAFGPRNLGLSREEVAQRVDWALDAVGIPDLRGRHPARLSGGEQQLVAIAAAMAMKPRVLVLDEPTASLDVDGTQHLVAALKGLRQELGMTIVLIEHRLAEVTQLASRAVIMNRGEIVADGDLLEVLSDRQTLFQLGIRRPVENPITPWESLLTPNGRVPADEEPLIRLDGISAGYNGLPAIEDISLMIYPGEFVALVGGNGAGKSTIGLVMAGLLKPFTGTLIYEREKGPRPGLDVSLLFQNPADQLFTDSVDEEVSFGPHNYRRFDPALHDQTMAKADLLAVERRRPFALSVGQQQRTALAACLSLRPRLLILDEPTLGQDWGHLQRLMDFLVELNHSGIAVLLITHDYKLVHRYAKRVVLIENGRISLDGRLQEEREDYIDKPTHPLKFGAMAREDDR